MPTEKRLYAVATSHLDTVWRWNLPKTISEYLLNTAGENFQLMQKYPFYKFNFEGSYRYELFEEYYPDVAERIKEYVKEGKWCPTGSAYENGDVNIPSPEALFRNILIGNNYFEDKFSIKSNDIYLPDCFGFGYALPAVIEHANLKGFSTQKLSWGCASGIPFDLGIWEGVGGKKIYAALNPGPYVSKINNFRKHSFSLEKIDENALPWTMTYYGVGDIGGAPDEGSVSALSSACALNSTDNLKVISASPSQVFNDLDALSDKDKAKLPKFNGELLMTQHGPGSYTSRCMSKRLNRQSEILADRAERAATAAMIACAKPYPYNALNTAWKKVIEHQFHDDITGTSHMVVYNRTWNEYYKALKIFENEYIGAVHAISKELDTSWVKGTAVIVSNTCSFDRKENVRASVKTKENSPYIRVYNADGEEVVSQIVSKKGKRFEIIFQADVPSVGYSVYDVRNECEKCKLASTLKVTEHTLENSKYKVVLNKNGDIASIIDKKLKKQILDAPIKLALLNDLGSFSYPSWEIRYEDISAQPVAFAHTPTFEIVLDGPAEIGIKVTRQANKSTFEQIITLSADGETVNVKNLVDWKSKHTMLKAQFPLTAYNMHASYDLGLGSVKRPNNTSLQHEVPAQKWADITDKSKEYGISVLSDCKIGWDKPQDNMLRLTCIHTPSGAFSPAARQDVQDLGKNRFSFALYSHSGSFENGTCREAECFNYPLTAFTSTSNSKGTLSSSFSLMSIDDEGVIVRAVKRAEKTNETVIRVNETSGVEHNGVRLKVNGIKSASYAFASEEKIKKAVVDDGYIVFNIKPFEVLTFVADVEKKFEQTSKEIQHSLPLPYNIEAVTTNKNRQSTVIQASGKSLPYELFPKQVECAGVVFDLADKDALCHALVTRGQKIHVPEEATKLYILLAGVRGDRTVKVKVGNIEHDLKVYDMFENIAQWDMFAFGQKEKTKDDAVLALDFTHTHSPQDDNYAEGATFFMACLDVKKADEITLPDDNSIVILAMTAVEQKSETLLATQLYDKADSENASQFAKENIITQNIGLTTLPLAPIQQLRHDMKTKKLFGEIIKIPKIKK